MGRVSGPCRHLTCCPQVLCDFPHTASAVPPDYLLDLIPPLRPRAFSIASSLQVSTAGGAWAAFLEMRQAPSVESWLGTCPPSLPQVCLCVGVRPATHQLPHRCSQAGYRSSWPWCSTRLASRSHAGASALPGWHLWIPPKVSPALGTVLRLCPAVPWTA